jgi:hypothetical protein
MLLAVLLSLLSVAQCAPAADGPAQPRRDAAPGRFIHLQRDKNNKPVALETPIIRFVPADGRSRAPIVDLVAAVHIADKGYYEQLNREFEGYDAVLYELVAPEEASAPKRSDPTGNHPISLLQNGMKDILSLEFQLKGIDYTRQNMVHADMSPEQFAESMRKRGETVMTMLARMLGYALTRQSEATAGSSDADLLLALFDKNRSLALKRILAEQFENSEGAMMALDGPTGSTLISGRNQMALEVLRKQLAAGKKKLAIFYGAAHMPDFQTRLRTEFGLVPGGTRWLTAWDLKR